MLNIHDIAQREEGKWVGGGRRESEKKGKKKGRGEGDEIEMEGGGGEAGKK